MSESEKPEGSDKPAAKSAPLRSVQFIPISAIARGRRYNASLAERIDRNKRRQALGWK